MVEVSFSGPESDCDPTAALHVRVPMRVYGLECVERNPVRPSGVRITLGQLYDADTHWIIVLPAFLGGGEVDPLHSWVILILVLWITICAMACRPRWGLRMSELFW